MIFIQICIPVVNLYGRFYTKEKPAMMRIVSRYIEDNEGY